MNAPHAPMSSALPFPLLWMASLLLLVLLAVGWARWQGVTVQFEEAPTVWQRELVFTDTPHGDVLVVDAATGQPVARFEGEQGFLRGTLRALARERSRRAIGPESALHLLAKSDGRLILLDPSTGEKIGLEAFGPSNLAVFVRLQPAPPGGGTTVVNERNSP